MNLSQSQTVRVNHQQMQSVELLQLSALELESYIQDLAVENPMVEPEESSSFSAPTPQEEDELLGKLRWLEENDHQNQFYQQMGEEELEDTTKNVAEALGL